jgi:acetyltransferase-like isoleucine patch superfamily enzyme
MGKMQKMKRALVRVGKRSYIGQNVKFYGHVDIGERAYIEDNVAIGKPNEEEIESFMETRRGRRTIDDFVRGKVIIGDDAKIRYGTIIHSNVTIGNRLDCFSNVIVGTRTKIGNNSRIGDYSQIHNDVVIGNDIRFKGYAANRCIIGNHVAMLGYLVHKFRENVRENIGASPVVMDDAIVGMLSVVVGGVQIGRGAYVAAGAVVLKNVGDKQMVAGVPARLIRKL